MGLRTQIRRKRHGRRASRRAQWTLGSDENELLDLIQLLRPIDAGHELIRIGGRGDGGYLIPNDLEGIGACFSPGVGPTSQFEQELATRFGIKCFLADASIEDPSFSAAESPFFDFENKFIGCHNSENFIRLEDWITDKYGTMGGGAISSLSTDDLMLQMDIEGDEFAVIVDTPRHILRRFRIMAIEFHNLHLLFEANWRRLFRSIFNKIVEDFYIVHIHPNNSTQLVSARGVDIPPVMEITLLRQDRARKTDLPLGYPHPLDEANCPQFPDIVLPDIFASVKRGE
ncbi:MAG: hypothetical protein OXE84_01805 [Rhodobacteraceae bacterium]|nr:hypothetical protein [Paracoccaceae bacterium]